MNKKSLSLFATALVLGFAPVMAQAYIGPGVGAGAIGAVIAVIGSVVLAIFAVIWYPVKRMLKARKKSASADSKTQAK